jgi:hypothetical protein
MNIFLRIVVTYSLLFCLLFCICLLTFIVLRRIIIQYQEAMFKTRYLQAEQEILMAISLGKPELAIQVAQKYKSQVKALTQVLVNFMETISGNGREILKIIFDHALKERLLKDLHSHLVIRRLRATRLLGLFAVSSETATFLELLHDKPLVKLAAVNALAHVPDQDTLSLVFQVFEKDSCPNIYTYTSIIFGIGNKIEPLIKNYLKKSLSVEKMSLLIELAGKIPLGSLYPELLDLASHHEKEIRIKVAKAFGKLLIPDSYETLLKLARDNAWEVQAQAIKSLGNLKNPEALEILTEALFSPFWYVRYNAREGLLKLGPQGIRRLEEVSQQKIDRFASDMAEMALDDLRYSR